MKEATATALDEVVVTGTGAQKKITMTRCPVPMWYKYTEDFHIKHY